MRLYVDSADLNSIERALATGYVRGVTTNPTLLRRAALHRSDIPSLVRRAVAAGADEIHLQVLADDATGMVRDAEGLFALDPARVAVKLPATGRGFAAGAALIDQGMRITFTAVYTIRQVVLAGITGAAYAAVYLDRMRQAGQNAFQVIEDMRQTVQAQQFPLRLLVASVRTAEDVESLARLGVPAITLPPDLVHALPEVQETLDALSTFSEDATEL